ncbi:hypothetical protein NQ318_021942 [Aromia moschata]|uniref:NADP-dependent oxidoreductase domain-containing protein n=1 Tax=Aromia moschata TaxID=1265417 RepID=A0AAV8XDS7_9CUCU|nr:hypothetical protein NQ318_021942 [Aromia moschata]
MSVNTFFDMPGGAKMPAIGLGTGGLRDESTVEAALNAAFDAGYRHFDTANMYQNEAFIGRVFKKWFSSGKAKRDDIFITTKLPFNGLHQDRVKMFMKQSLENLQLDYVDLYLIHFPIGFKYEEGPFLLSKKEVDDNIDHIAVWKKMEEQVDAGRTKAIGLSNFNQRQIERIMKTARIKPSCLQIELHVHLLQKDLVKYCHDNGMVVVAYSPLLAPGFTGEKRSIPPPMENATVKKIAAKYNKTDAQILLRYLVQKKIVPIPKSSNPVRMKENIEIFDFNIESADIKSLDDLEAGEMARLRKFDHFGPGIPNHPEFPFPG